MKFIRTAFVVAAIAFAAPSASHAQILVAGEGPVVYGHHHLNTTNMDAQKKFYVDTLGGTVVKFGSGDRAQEIIKFPNVLMFFRPMQAPTGGSVAATVKVTDDVAAASPTTNIAFALGPEDVKVEFVEVKTQKAPIQLHHIHF